MIPSGCTERCDGPLVCVITIANVEKAQVIVATVVVDDSARELVGDDVVIARTAR